MNELVNRGVILLNMANDLSKSSDAQTVIVTGVARGGTSMTASILHGLGLFIGDKIDDVVFEDIEILTALQTNNIERFRNIVSNRNEKYRKWGFKVPNLHQFIAPDEIRSLRNPRCVVIFRDPVAVACRNGLSMKTDTSMAIQQASEDISQMSLFISRLSIPTLLISYEKALQDYSFIISNISKFCSIDYDDNSLDLARQRIVPNSSSYLFVSNENNPYIGQIDNIDNNILRGWCCYRDSAEYILVELFVNNIIIGVFPSNNYRNDLSINNIHLGNNSFLISLGTFCLVDTDLISVRPVGCSFFLPNSGKQVRELRLRQS